MSKIMVVDDSTTICKSAELFLKDSGHKIILADDGFDALAKIEQEIPDLIFIDVMMPKLDGLKTCQLIKNNDEFKHIPIVFLSSKDTEFDKARGFLVGGSDYLTKPFSKDQILATIQKFLV